MDEFFELINGLSEEGDPSTEDVGVNAVVNGVSYILIQNKGIIESNSFELIGASTKRDQQGMIGFFGSGLKYSIAYMMRNNMKFHIFAGEKEIMFTTIPEKLKDQEFNRICIDGKPTSYTTTMGPTWDHDWMVLREIYCNAIDEGKFDIIKDTINVSGSEGYTRIYIELTKSLRVVNDNWDFYFSDERTPLFTVKNVYTSSIGVNDGNGNRQDVIVYSKTAGILFRKGIRVYDEERLTYDYEMANVKINEDRTASDAYYISYAFCDMMTTFCNEKWVCSILANGSAMSVNCNEYIALNDSPRSPFSDKWIDFSKQNLLVVRELSGKFSETINHSSRPAYLIPHAYASRMKAALPDVEIIGTGYKVGDYSVELIEPTAKMQFLIKDTIKVLGELGIAITHPIKVAIFDSVTIKGKADTDNNQIILSDNVFEDGRHKIAMTMIIEQYMLVHKHVNASEKDKVYNLRELFLSKWIAELEEKAGLFL